MKDKRVVVALLALLVAALFVGGSAYTWYSHTLEAKENEFTAGTLYLTAGGTGLETINIDNVYPGWGVRPGAEGGNPYYAGTEFEATKTYILKNSGTIDGVLGMHFKNIEDIAASIEGLPPELSNDHLSNYLYVTMIIEGDEKIEHKLFSNIEYDESGWLHLGKLSAGKQVEITLTFYVDENAEYIQGTSLTFDAAFKLEQYAIALHGENPVSIGS